MKPETFYHPTTLVAKGKQYQHEVDVISFDLFDTLLVRRTHDPDLIKLPVARYISELAEAAGLNWKWDAVQIKRDECERAMRAKTGESYVDHEACYPVFMQQTLEAIFADKADSALLQQVTDYELKIENAMLVPRKDIVDWLKALSKAGKRVFVVSDMYLPAVSLRVLLEAADILPYVEEVISSADRFLAKASGEGYKYLINEYKLQPAKWLHVGDNPISDGFRAVEHGVRSLLLQDPEEHRRRAIAARQYFNSVHRPFWKGRSIQQLMAPLEAENAPRSHLYTEGYNFIGPLISIFVHNVAEHCRKNQIGKIFFLSREGWMFKQVWEKITPVLYPQGNLPDVEYLYVSRQALAGTSCAYTGLTQLKADIVFLPPGNKDFSDVCRVFSLPQDIMLPHLRRYALEMDSVLSPIHGGFEFTHRINFELLIKDKLFQQTVKEQLSNANQGLQKYLESLGFYDHDDVALVDIGWLGTIQRFFHDAISHREDRPNLHGLLLGATRGIPFPTTRDNSIKGLLYDKENFDFASSAILYARDLFEEACRAPYPTLNGYKLTTEGEHELVFREMADAIGQGEQAQDRHYADLQQGVLDAADRFGAAAAMVSPSMSDYRSWCNYLLVSKLAFAKQREINNIRHVHHLDDFHGANKPRKSRRPKLFHNPWEARGIKQWFGCRLARWQFRNHLKKMVNNQL